MNALIVFLKKPIKGKVKTRIARDSSEEYALNAYRHIAQVSLNAISKFPNLFVFSDKYLESTDFEIPEHAQFFLQPTTGNLGDKMIACIEKVRALGYRNVGILGVDCPNVTLQILQDGYHSLSDFDISIGPSEDGGFYFLACQDQVDLYRLFEDVEWSTAKVFLKTCENAALINHRIFSCTKLYDIDFKSDYQRFLDQKK